MFDCVEAVPPSAPAIRQRTGAPSFWAAGRRPSGKPRRTRSAIRQRTRAWRGSKNSSGSS